MNYLSLFFLASIAFFGSTHLVASEDREYLTHSWSLDNENVYLEIDIAEGLAFADTYSVLESKDGLEHGILVSCKPMQEGILFSEEGHELEEIEFFVTLTNSENFNQLSYVAEKVTTYKGLVRDGLLSSVNSRSTKKGVLNNLAIDINDEDKPIFGVSNEGNTGIAVFKRLLP